MFLEHPLQKMFASHSEHVLSPGTLHNSIKPVLLLS